MAWTYSCPHCGNVVNPDETVTLIGILGEEQMLVGFHPKPGNYTTYLPPGVQVNVGERWSFYCPLCRADLTAEEYDNLVALILHDGAIGRRVLFSKIFGQRATYLIKDQQLDEIHGDDAKTYDMASKSSHPPNPVDE